MPAEFCAALARALSVNPNWLLLGEGGMFLTDVTAPAGELARGMRELVDAMNAASRLRLGALSRRKDLGLLRELSEASARHDQQRRQLGEHVAPIAKQWLAALRAAIDRRDMVSVDDLHGALERLLSFTDDSALHTQFDRHRAVVSYLRGDRAAAVSLQRRNLMRSLAEGGQIGESQLRESHNLCVALSGLGLSRQGRAVAEATLALRGRDSAPSPMSDMVQALLGLFEISLGEVARGVAISTELLARRVPANSDNIELLAGAVMLRVQGLGGLAVLREFAPKPPLVIDVLRQMIWREDATQLQAVLDWLREHHPAALAATQFFGAQAEWVLRLLRRSRRKGAPAQFEAMEARVRAVGPLADLELAVMRCQRLRLLRSPEAADANQRAEALVRGLDAEVSPDHSILGLHVRNMLALGTQQQAATWRQWARAMHGRGFGMFRGLMHDTPEKA